MSNTFIVQFVYVQRNKKYKPDFYNSNCSIEFYGSVTNMVVSRSGFRQLGP